MTSAAHAAKKGRQEQIQLYEEYLEGKEVEFKSHQGKGGDTYTYDPSVYTKVRVPVKLKFNQNSVFLDAVMNDDEETVKGLLDGEDPVSPDAVNHNGCSGLVLAAIENNMKIAQILIDHKAKVDLHDIDHWTPLHAAAACGHWRMMNFLIANGADVTYVNADGDLPLDNAEGGKCVKILEAEYSRMGLSEDDLQSHREGKGKQLQKKVDEMYEAKVDFNSKDSEGASLLHSAASNGFAKVVTFLIAEEVNLNVADDHGDTPLHLAVFFNYPDVVSLLGAAGCEMEPLNRMQEAPMFYAEQLGEEKEGDATMIRLLKALIAKKKADSGDATRKKINASSNSVKRKSIAEKTNTKKKDGKNMAAEMAAFNGEEIVMFDDGSGSDADAKDKKKGKKGEKNSKKITHQASAKKEKARGSIVPGGAIDADIDAHNDGLQHAEGTHVDHHHHKAARMSMVDGELAGLDAKKKGGGCCIVM